jgi:hypothetical protein
MRLRDLRPAGRIANSGSEGLPTIHFEAIDAGASGSAAAAVFRLIHRRLFRHQTPHWTGPHPADRPLDGE